MGNSIFSIIYFKSCLQFVASIFYKTSKNPSFCRYCMGFQTFYFISSVKATCGKKWAELYNKGRVVFVICLTRKKRYCSLSSYGQTNRMGFPEWCNCVNLNFRSASVSLQNTKEHPVSLDGDCKLCLRAKMFVLTWIILCWDFFLWLEDLILTFPQLLKKHCRILGLRSL